MTMKMMLGVVIVAAALAPPQAMTFTATATAKSAAKSASVPVQIRIDRFVGDADREKVLAAIKADDAQGTLRLLQAMNDIGFISVGEKRTPIKYAYARPTGGGRMITVVTAQPIHFVGGAAPDAKPKQGYDLALALLVLDGSDRGDGELAPAVKVKVDANGAIVTDDYGSEVVRLTGIKKGN